MKNTFRRIACTILSMVFLFNFATVAMAASTSLSLDLSTPTAEEGNLPATVSMTVGTEDALEIMSFSGEAYASDPRITIAQIQDGDKELSATNTNTGRFAYMTSSNKSVKEWATIVFSIPADLDAGIYTMGVRSVSTSKTDNSNPIAGITEKSVTFTVTAPTTYTVTVSNNGHGTATATPSTAAAGTEIVLSASANTGYHFKEWQVVSGGVTITDNKFTMPAGNVEVKAIFEANPPATYTVTMSNDGHGTATATPSTAAAGTEIVLSASANTGKEWQVVSGGVTITDNKFTMPAGNVEVKAIFEANSYTVTFNANGGSVTPASAATNAEGKLTTLPTPTRSGSYSFNGWYTTASGGSHITTDTIFNANTTIYAQWTYTGGGSSGGGGGSVSTTYSITVEDAKNGDVTVSPRSASKGDTVTVTVDPDAGYTMEALTVTDKNGKEIELTKVSNTKYTFKMPSGKVTVKATFMEDNTMLNYFVDVFANDYYYDAVLWAVEHGITNGTSATTFSPSNPCTRAQMATFLWRAAGSPEPVGGANPFVDVPADAYYTKAVQWAYEQGITGGTSATTFSPDNTCTRGQMATFLWRDAGSSVVNGEGTPFVDVTADTYYTTAVDWAYEQGITGGTSATTFSPNDPCTRGQMVTFLYRYLAD